MGRVVVGRWRGHRPSLPDSLCSAHWPCIRRGLHRSLQPPDRVEAVYGRMPPPLQRALLPFQREGVRFGLARGGRCLIADEMGVVGAGEGRGEGLVEHGGERRGAPLGSVGCRPKNNPPSQPAWL